MEAMESRLLLSTVSFDGSGKAVEFTDYQGNVVVVKLTGGGSGTVEYDGTNASDYYCLINLTGTGDRSELTITVKGATKQATTTVNEIVVSGGGSLKSLKAPQVNLSGRIVDGDIVDGNLTTVVASGGSVSLNMVLFSSVTLAGVSTSVTKLELNHVFMGEVVAANMPVELKTVSWADSVITAAYFTKITSTDAMSGTIKANSFNPKNGVSIDNLTVNGAYVGGDTLAVDVPGAIHNINVINLKGSVAAGSINNLTTRGQKADAKKGQAFDAGDMGATITLSGAGVAAGKNTLNSVKVAGALTGNMLVNGAVGHVTAGTINTTITAAYFANIGANTVTGFIIATSADAKNNVSINNLTMKEALTGGQSLAVSVPGAINNVNVVNMRGSITAGSIGNFSTKAQKADAKKGLAYDAGDMEASITLTGAGVAANKNTLNSIKVAGALTGGVTVAGAVGHVTAGSIDTFVIASWFSNISANTIAGTITATSADARNNVSINNLTMKEALTGGQSLAVSASGAINNVNVVNLKGSIIASAIGNLTTKAQKADAKKGLAYDAGNMEATIILSGMGVAADKNTLNSVKVAGALTGGVTVMGAVGHVTAGTINTTIQADYFGNISANTITGAITATSSEPRNKVSINNLTMKEALTGGQSLAVSALGAINKVDVVNLKGSITAAAIGSLTTKEQKADAKKGLAYDAGNMEAAITLSGVGVAANKNTLNSAKVAGTLMGDLTVTGDAGTIEMKSLLATLNVTGKATVRTQDVLASTEPVGGAPGQLQIGSGEVRDKNGSNKYTGATTLYVANAAMFAVADLFSDYL